MIKAKKAPYLSHGKPERRPNLLSEDNHTIVNVYGAEWRSIVQYYLLAGNVARLYRLLWVMETSLLKTLANKHRSTVSRMARTYAATIATPFGPRKCFEARVVRSGRKPLVARFGGIPLRRQLDAAITDRVLVPGIVRRTELVDRLQAGRCEICRCTEDISVHHIRKLADLHRPGAVTTGMGGVDGQAATQDPGGLPLLPRRRPRREAETAAHVIVIGEPVAVKVTQRVRAGGRRKRTRLRRVPRQRPTSAIWNNLAGAVERTVARHKDCLTAVLAAQTDDAGGGEADDSQGQLGLDLTNPPSSPPAGPSDRTDRWAVRARERHKAVHALLAEGVGINAIRRLSLARDTVRRFARADTVEELLTRNGTGRRPSLLDEFKPYLHKRWNEGCTNAAVLLAEITTRGYQGGTTLLRQYLHQFRTALRIPQPPRKPPSVRRVVGWIMTDPATIDATDQQRLDAILTASPHLTALAGHVRAFAAMMCSLRGQELEAWMAAVDADDQPALRSFVVGLRRDQDAVTAGLTLPWNSGPVEGHVNRIKTIKRQMYGRAKPDLLRKRILLST